MNKMTTLALAGLVSVAAVSQASESRWAGFGAAADYIADVQDIWTLPGALVNYKNATYLELGNNPYNSNEDGNAGAHLSLGPGVLGVWVGRDAYQNNFNVLRDIDSNFAFNGSRISRNYYNSILADAAEDVADDGNFNDENGDVNYWNTRAERIASEMPLYGRLNLLYAFDLSDTVALGFGIERAAAERTLKSNDSNNSYKSTLSASDLGFSVGAEIKEVAIFKLVEVGLKINMANQLVEGVAVNGDREAAVNNAMMTALRVGADTAGENGAFGRVELGFKTGSDNNKFEHSVSQTEDSSGKVSASMWNIGYAAGVAGDKGLGLLGVKLTGNSVKAELVDNVDNALTYGNASYSADSMDVIVAAAAEYKAKEWLTVRFGADSNVFGSTTEKFVYLPVNNGDYTQGESNAREVNFSEGISLNLGALTIDGVLDQSLVFAGPYLLTGNSTWTGLNTKVSTTYVW